MSTQWWTDAADPLKRKLARDPYWKNHQAELRGPTGLHLGVFTGPYLDLILQGEKTIESRFGVQRCAPHGRVAVGDILLLKAASGPIRGVCRIAETWFFDLTRTPLSDVRRRFGAAICAVDDAFWVERADARLVTLMRVERAIPISPVHVAKKDRRGWVTLREQAPLFATARA